MNLALFDIDGTLTATNDIDTVCFVRAARETLGTDDIDTRWESYEEQTDSYLLAELSRRARGRDPLDDEVRSCRERFVALLGDALALDRSGFAAVAGGPAMLAALRSAGVAVAFATGGWGASARLKLEAAGYPTAGCVLASADDAQARALICRTAIARAQQVHGVQSFAQVTYVGDGLWDQRAADALGLGFVGVGANRDRFGSSALLRLDDYRDPDTLLQVLARAHPAPPGPGQESVWDYPRPPRVEPEPRAVEIVLGGEVIASSTRAIRVLETSHPPVYYIPAEDFVAGALVAAPGSSSCEWKGRAVYFDVVGGGQRRSKAAWGYPDPTALARSLRDHVAVYAAPMDRCLVGGEVATPQPGGFYGGWVTSWVAGPFKGGPGSWGW